MYYETQTTTQSNSMASSCCRRIVEKSVFSAKALLGRTPPTSSPRLSLRPRAFFSSRLPVELGCGESLMPLHSVTASALLNSLLSSNVGQWGSLSEGFATPL